MGDSDLTDIVAKIREREASGSATNATAKPVSIPLSWIDWSDPSNERRIPILAKLCELKPEIDFKCSGCTRGGISRCSAYRVRYCSKTCQNADWGRHKRICKKFAEFDYTRRPSKDDYLAILLPTDQKEPELVWCSFPNDATQLQVTHPDVHRLRHCEPRGHALQVNTSVTTGKLYLGHGLALLDVYGLAEIESEGLLNVNQSISALARPGALSFYSGPQIIFAFEGNAVGEPAKGMDVTPRDWRHATDYIVLSPKNPFLCVVTPGLHPTQFAVKINNTESLLVSQIHHIDKPIESVIAPVSYWPRGGPCSAAFQLGLPWKTRCILGCELARFPGNMKYLAAYLHRKLTANDDGTFEWTTTSQYKCGSIVIVSIGKNRFVHIHHVIALNKYLDYSLKRCIVPSKEGFMEYWEKYTAVTNHRDEDMRSIASPYHCLPNLEELVVSPGESASHRNAVMNLLGHFSSKGFKMEVKKVGDEFVPVDVEVPLDTHGTFGFTDEERDVPGGLFAPFGTAKNFRGIRGTRDESD